MKRSGSPSTFILIQKCKGIPLRFMPTIISLGQPLLGGSSGRQCRSYRNDNSTTPILPCCGKGLPIIYVTIDGVKLFRKTLKHHTETHFTLFTFVPKRRSVVGVYGLCGTFPMPTLTSPITRRARPTTVAVSNFPLCMQLGLSSISHRMKCKCTF